MKPGLNKGLFTYYAKMGGFADFDGADNDFDGADADIDGADFDGTDFDGADSNATKHRSAPTFNIELKLVKSGHMVE